MASTEVPIAAPAAAAPARREGITHVAGDYVAGLWYGEAPAPLPPSTSYVMPFERKASAQQRKAELERIKHDRTEAEIAEAKRKGGVLGSLKATTMSVFAKARGTTSAPANRKLARKEKKFNTIFKFAQPETLLYQSKKLRLINRHNNSSMLGKLWISSNFICFRESLRGTKTRTMITIPVREIVCIQRARALKVMEANAVPEFQPYNDMDSSADSLQIYMRDRELHQLTGFWDHKSLEDTYHTLDYVWRPAAYAAEIPPPIAAHHEVPPAEASGSSSPSSVSEEAHRTVPPYAAAAAVPVAAAPVAAAAVGAHALGEREVLRTAPPYAAAAVPVAAAPMAAAPAVPAAGVATYPLKEREVLRTAPPYAAVAPAMAAPVAAAPMRSERKELPVPPAPLLKVSPPAEEVCTTVCTTVPVAAAPIAAAPLAAAPVAPVLGKAQVVFSEPFVVRPVGESAIVSSLAPPAPEALRQLPVFAAEPMPPRRALPADLRTQIENFSAFFPRRHVALPARPPLAALFAASAPLAASPARAPESFAPQAMRFAPATFMPAESAYAAPAPAPSLAAKSQSLSGLTGGARRAYPRQPEALLREIRAFRRSSLLRPRVRRGWRSPAFARLLRDVRTFNLRKLKHVPAPIIRSQLPQVRLRRRGAATTRAYPSLMSEELQERIRAFASLGLLANFRHVTPVENRFLIELRAARLPLPHARSSPHRQLLNEIARFNHSWLRQTRTPRRRFAQYPGLDEIRKLNRNSPKMLQEIRAFDRARLRHTTAVRLQLPIQTARQTTAAASSERHPEWSPVAQMPWWPSLAAAIRQQGVRRLRHVPQPSVPVFRAPAATEQSAAPKPTPMRDTTMGLSSAKIEVIESKRVVIMERQLPTQTFNSASDAAGLSV